MALVRRGSMLEGLSGRVGDLVFRTRGDRTIVSRRPGQRRRKGPRSAARQQTISRFQEAVQFAREARHRHAYRSLSRVLGGYSPYHIALQDYLSEPEIQAVDASHIGPGGGDLIIHVSERVAVRAVRVHMPGSAGGREPIPFRPRTITGKVRLAPAKGLEAPETSPGTKGGESAPRLPIPAALFFKRVPEVDGKRKPPASETDAEKGPEGPAEDPGTWPIEGDQDDRHPPAGDAPTDTSAGADFGEVRVWAKRRLGLQRRPDNERDTPRSEIWLAKLPRPGEVEITASDYAGNRAVRRFRVGPWVQGSV